MVAAAFAMIVAASMASVMAVKIAVAASMVAFAIAAVSVVAVAVVPIVVAASMVSVVSVKIVVAASVVAVEIVVAMSVVAVAAIPIPVVVPVVAAEIIAAMSAAVIPIVVAASAVALVLRPVSAPVICFFGVEFFRPVAAQLRIATLCPVVPALAAQPATCAAIVLRRNVVSFVHIAIHPASTPAAQRVQRAMIFTLITISSHVFIHLFLSFGT